MPFSLTSSYILSFNDANDIKASLKDIIGNESVANRIATEILKSRGQVGAVVLTDYVLASSEGRTNNRLKAKAIRRKRYNEGINTKCILYFVFSHVQTQSTSSKPEPVKEDNPNSVPSTPVKDKKKVDERVEFTHPIKSSVIRIVFPIRIPRSQGKVSLSGNETSGAVQLHGVWEHHLQGGGVGGVHLLRRLQPALQTQVQKREGGGSVDEGDREQGAIHSRSVTNRTVCFSTTVTIRRARKCMGWREE